MEEITNYNCEGMCCEQNCSKKYTHHTTIEKNGMKIHLCFCKKHADIYEAFEFNNEKQLTEYTIECEKDDKQLKFFCEYCGEWHFHGEGEGHRHAHCSNLNSPYQKTGYYLKLKRNKINKILEFLKRDSERCIIGIDNSDKKEYPIIAVWKIDDTHVAFWCPDCERLHLHSWNDGKPNGQKFPHCINPDSWLKNNGYVISYQADLTDPVVLDKYLNEGKERLPTPDELNGTE